MSDAPESRRRYKVRRADGEVDYVDHDELWRVQHEETERIHSERRRRRRLLTVAAAGIVIVALLAGLLLWIRGRAAGPAVGAEAAAPGQTPAAPAPGPVGADTTAGPAAERSAPGPVAAAAGEPALLPEEAVAATVRSWAAAWSRQDLEGYLAHYSPEFRPADGSPRSLWKDRRRRRVLSPEAIEVELAALEVQLLVGDGRAEARFRQAYRSPSYSDLVLKTLTLAEEEGGWRIVREQAEPLSP